MGYCGPHSFPGSPQESCKELFYQKSRNFGPDQYILVPGSAGRGHVSARPRVWLVCHYSFMPLRRRESFRAMGLKFVISL